MRTVRVVIHGSYSAVGPDIMYPSKFHCRALVLEGCFYNLSVPKFSSYITAKSFSVNNRKAKLDLGSLRERVLLSAEGRTAKHLYIAESDGKRARWANESGKD